MKLVQIYITTDTGVMAEVSIYSDGPAKFCLLDYHGRPADKAEEDVRQALGNLLRPLALFASLDGRRTYTVACEFNVREDLDSDK